MVICPVEDAQALSYSFLVMPDLARMIKLTEVTLELPGPSLSGAMVVTGATAGLNVDILD